jgi:ribosomal-protein-alanine N-acetyltransferase
MTAPAPLHLRPGQLSDAAGMAWLHATGFDEGWSEADFLGWLGRAEAFAAVVEGKDGVLLAFGLALTAGEDVEILTIVTDPALRSAGLGRQVLGALDAAARARGLSRWLLEVATDNLPALTLYRHDGFMEIGRRKGYYSRAEGRCDALVMARSVRAGEP